MIICDETLLMSGYKEFEKPVWVNEFVYKFYQKRIEDEKGTRYFINVYTYYDEESGLTDYEFRLQTESLANGKKCFFLPEMGRFLACLILFYTPARV